MEVSAAKLKELYAKYDLDPTQGRYMLVIPSDAGDMNIAGCCPLVILAIDETSLDAAMTAWEACSEEEWIAMTLVISEAWFHGFTSAVDETLFHGTYLSNGSEDYLHGFVEGYFVRKELFGGNNE